MLRRHTALGSAIATGAMVLGALGATPAAAGTTGSRTVDYVALGDSYAAAPGVPEQTDAACGRSSANYPSLVAASRGARLKDVSCSGATTADSPSDRAMPLRSSMPSAAAPNG